MAKKVTEVNPEKIEADELIRKYLAKKPDLNNLTVLETLFDLAKYAEDLKINDMVLKYASKNVRYDEGFYKLYEKALKYASDKEFDKYMLYLEFDRPVEERFWQPRRKQLLPLVEKIQKLIDGELDELFIHLPPRVGKTTLLAMLLTFIGGKYPESRNLYSSFSTTVTKAFYKGQLEIMADSHTYRWGEIFTGTQIVQTDAKDTTVNIGRKTRYPSITCRSIDATLNGACDCDNFLIADDLVSGIEEALSPNRLEMLWSKVENDLLSRLSGEKTKILWCGTRWSLKDPAGMRMNLLMNNSEYKDVRWDVINIPALDPVTDESNFQYGYDVGFTTDFYRQRRASFEMNSDIASWLALYMQEPVERAGSLFAPDNLKFYNGVLPDVEPDRVWMVVDPAYGGGDYTAAPIVYQYGKDDMFVADVVYNNGERTETQAEIVKKIIKHKVTKIHFEETKTTADYRKQIIEALNKRRYHISAVSKAAPGRTAKDIRIQDAAPDIREMYFIEPGNARNKEYDGFMNEMYSYKIEGKNKHDDACDAMSMLAKLWRKAGGTVRVLKRQF
jgi:predicted phage terminase large subunit-like protein